MYVSLRGASLDVAAFTLFRSLTMIKYPRHANHARQKLPLSLLGGAIMTPRIAPNLTTSLLRRHAAVTPPTRVFIDATPHHRMPFSLSHFLVPSFFAFVSSAALALVPAHRLAPRAVHPHARLVAKHHATEDTSFSHAAFAQHKLCCIMWSICAALGQGLFLVFVYELPDSSSGER